jgi:hypothetical protein
MRRGRRRHRRSGKRFFPQRLNETRENEDQKRDECGNEAIDAKRFYNKNLKKSEIEGNGDTDKRYRLENAAQKPVKKNKLKSCENKENAVKNDTKVSDWDAEDLRIRTFRNHIAIGQMDYITEERRIIRFVLRDVCRIGNAAESEKQYKHYSGAFHSA